MCQLTFGRDGVKALAASLGPANDPKVEASRRFRGHKCGYRDETQSVETEYMEHRRIFALADEPRPDALTVKPLLDRSTQPCVSHRQQRRRAIQRFWETGSKLPGQ